ncbi:DUF2630 family protein [Nocardia barduliensis]|uniref:DUF2630 family protein n=1 Tax=Nocardia barduliensis TaxID=2736643 RepID=UPI001571DE42|nr:DUF2630 family protein [Nocardia barduliensis]
MDEEREVLARINRLAAEEHAFERSLVGRDVTNEDLRELHRIEKELDRHWDLLRRLRARRRARMGIDYGEIPVRRGGRSHGNGR